MTTPEQLAKWREDATSFYINAPVDLERLGHSHFYIDGYLRAKQENEQAIKDARKQALEDALAIVKNENKFGDIEFEIKELLK